jgi:hypothetical protein
LPGNRTKFHWDRVMLGTRRRDGLALCLLCVMTAWGCTYYPFGQAEEPVPAYTPPSHHVAERATHLASPSSAAQRNTKLASSDTRIDGLVGLSEQQVQKRFGQPAAQEQHQPGTAWIYRDAECRLAVSFYPDVRTHNYKALGYEVKSNADTNAGKSRCTARFAAKDASK